MAQAPEIVTIPDEDDDVVESRSGPHNLISMEEYAESLDNVVLQFKRRCDGRQKGSIAICGHLIGKAYVSTI